MSDALEFDFADEIKHLSLNEIEELYQKYLDGEKNSILIKDYKININPNKLIGLFPPKVLDEICPYCDKQMYVKRKAKSTSDYDAPPIKCFTCNHQIYSEKFRFFQKCSCENCKLIRMQQELEVEKAKRALIQKIYDPKNIEPIDYSELGFFHKLVLLTLFRVQTDETFDYILSFDDSPKIASLSPTPKMDIECIDELYNHGIIIVDPESKIDAFDEKEDCNSFDINKVGWILNVTFNSLERANISNVCREIYDELKNGVQTQWEKEIYKILFKISREEVLQYIYVKAFELDVHFSAEIKTREVVDQLLLNFSISEIYYFVKKSVEDAHIFFSKGCTSSKKHAANIIPNRMLSLSERAISEKWDTYKYTRDSRAPRSCISQIFHDFFLQDEDVCFHKSPGQYWVQELLPKYFSKNKDTKKVGITCDNCTSENLRFQRSLPLLEMICEECGNVERFTLCS